MDKIREKDDDRKRRGRRSDESEDDRSPSRSRSRSPRGDDKRKKSKKKSKESKKRRRSRSVSSSSSDSDSASDSEASSSSSSSDSEEERRRRKKRRKEKKSKERSSKDKKSKKKKKKEREREKKSAKNHANKSYGKYGVLRGTDMWSKQAELFAWLHECKGMDPETIPRSEMKTYFEDYMEAYNTATLPGKKYYDLEKWTNKELKKGKKGDDHGDVLFNDPFAFNDEELIRQERARQRAASKAAIGRSELQDMARVMRERREEEYKKKVGLDTDDNRGVRWM